jgi:aldose 1-epimerase
MRKVGSEGVVLALVAAAAAALTSGTASAAEVQRAPAGTLKDGTAIEAITLAGDNGVSARILTYGATLQSLIAPDRDGNKADVVLGYDDLADYVDHPNYFGVTVGRYANRIAGGTFTLDGKRFQLPLNDKTNSLHGGGKGFDKQAWRVVSVKNGPVASVVLAHRSPDGDSGYPGQFDVTVTYSLDDKGSLTIAFEGKTSKPTVVNMTNHAIFNLAGEGSLMGATGHRLTVPAATYTPVDAKLIPTGERRPVAGTVFDFRTPRVVADGIRDGRDQQIRYGQRLRPQFRARQGPDGQAGTRRTAGGPTVGPRARGADHRARRPVLHRQLPGWHLSGQEGSPLPHG